MSALLLTLLLQAGSPGADMASDFRHLCIDHQGAPVAVYAAAATAGWSVDPDDARFRARSSASGKVTLVAVDNDAAAVCYVSIDAQVEGVGLPLLARYGLGVETVTLQPGNSVNVIRTVDGQPAPQGWVVMANTSPDFTVIMLLHK